LSGLWSFGGEKYAKFRSAFLERIPAFAEDPEPAQPSDQIADQLPAPLSIEGVSAENLIATIREMALANAGDPAIVAELLGLLLKVDVTAWRLLQEELEGLGTGMPPFRTSVDET
jgi:hypothetical protein